MEKMCSMVEYTFSLLLGYICGIQIYLRPELIGANAHHHAAV
jgi:hypothetical protein